MMIAIMKTIKLKFFSHKLEIDKVTEKNKTSVVVSLAIPNDFTLLFFRLRDIKYVMKNRIIGKKIMILSKY